MTQSLPQFDAARVLVVGDVMLDRYWEGDTGRISPEAPVPVVRVRDEVLRPGGAANVAVNVASLGASVTLLGLVGADENAGHLHGALREAGVTPDFVEVADRPTVCKLRVTSRHQQLIRLDFESAFEAGPAHARLAERFTALLGAHDVVLVSDYAKGTLADVEALIAAARSAGRPVVVDPKGTDFARYAGASGMTPNLAEFEAVVGGERRDELRLVESAEALRAELALDWLLVTRGEDGMSLVQRGSAPVHRRARTREVFDVTGAGDTVLAVLGAALAADADVVRATALANLAAGAVVAKQGTASVSASELARAAADHAPGAGVLDEEQLLERLADARRAGERVVFTNGCFDILHPGHVACLQAASRFGDRLVVAVNGDGSVRRLKGAGRPINTVEDRMAVMAGLGVVDWVVAFDEDTPARLIERLAPDVLVKGGDYRVEDVAGADSVLARGGRVEIVDLVPGHSTTATVTALSAAREPTPGEPS